MKECKFNNGLCKKNECSTDSIEDCKNLITRCPVCGAIFEEDDFAYTLNTGLCQYCHEEV